MLTTADIRKIAEAATERRVTLDKDVEHTEWEIEAAELKLANLRAVKAEIEFDLNLAAEAEHHAWDALSEAEGIDYNNMSGTDY